MCMYVRVHAFVYVHVYVCVFVCMRVCNQNNWKRVIVCKFAC